VKVYAGPEPVNGILFLRNEDQVRDILRRRVRLGDGNWA
jgi:hypothetical protein